MIQEYRGLYPLAVISLLSVYLRLSLVIIIIIRWQTVLCWVELLQ